MKRIYIIVLALIFNISFSQKRELGEVTIDELKEKFHPSDTAATAAILFMKGKTQFTVVDDEFFVQTDVLVKIKIYKKEGYEHANIALAYYSPSSGQSESVDFSKATTYNLVNGQIEKTKVKSENIFVEQKTKNTKIKKLTMPAVKEGCVIEYKYSILSPFISNIPDWYFQYDIPVNYSEYIIDVPEYYKYNTYSKGSLPLVITTEMMNRNITFNGNSNGVSRFQFTDHRTTYKIENVPALKDESFVNNINNYRSSLTHEHASTMMPQSTYQYYAKTWEDVCKKIYEDEEFGPQMRKTGYFDDDVKVLMAGLNSDEEKIAALLNYVQQRITWNSNFRIFTEKGVRKAYEDKTGNYADINLMLVGMLRFVGINAHPILISTRANGIALFPSFSAYNAVIVGVKRGDKIILLDATSKNTLPDIIPTRDLNWFGRMLLDDGTTEMVDLMPKLTSLNQENCFVEIKTDGKAIGKVRVQKLDYEALRFREQNKQLSYDTQMERLEKSNPGLLVSDFELIETSLQEALVEKYSFEYSNGVEIIGNKMLIKPLVHLGLDENPFKQEKRECPIDFLFPFRDKQMVVMTLPEGYVVETLPENIALALENNNGNFAFSITRNENKLMISTNFEIKTSIIPTDEYESLKEFFKLIIDKTNEKIVLKKG
ncbi:MAG: hypothetical protein RLZZ500_1140 [Bacteroidota bacterium]|jgi:hypothetical protein